MNINLTIFGQVVSFAIFVWFCAKFVWPPIVNAMQEREKKIADGLAAADRAVLDLGLCGNLDALGLFDSPGLGFVDDAVGLATRLLDDRRGLLLGFLEMLRNPILSKLEVTNGAVGGGQTIGDLLLALLHGADDRRPHILGTEPDKDGEGQHLPENGQIDVHINTPGW